MIPKEDKIMKTGSKLRGKIGSAEKPGHQLRGPTYYGEVPAPFEKHCSKCLFLMYYKVIYYKLQQMTFSHSHFNQLACLGFSPSAYGLRGLLLST